MKLIQSTIVTAVVLMFVLSLFTGSAAAAHDPKDPDHTDVVPDVTGGDKIVPGGGVAYDMPPADRFLPAKKAFDGKDKSFPGREWDDENFPGSDWDEKNFPGADWNEKNFPGADWNENWPDSVFDGEGNENFPDTIFDGEGNENWPDSVFDGEGNENFPDTIFDG